MPYATDCAPSFEMCSCGFEFGFDDDPGASADAINSVQGNRRDWRGRLFCKLHGRPVALAELVARLRAIGVEPK